MGVITVTSDNPNFILGVRKYPHKNSQYDNDDFEFNCISSRKGLTCHWNANNWECDQKSDLSPSTHVIALESILKPLITNALKGTIDYGSSNGICLFRVKISRKTIKLIGKQPLEDIEIFCTQVGYDDDIYQITARTTGPLVKLLEFVSCWLVYECFQLDQGDQTVQKCSKRLLLRDLPVKSFYVSKTLQDKTDWNRMDRARLLGRTFL